MCRRKIENRDQLLADVDEYIRDHSPVSLEELVQAMQNLGYDCTPRMVRPILKERGLKVKSVNGRWFWGSWDDEDDEAVDDEDEDDDERPVPEPLKKAQTENARLQEENNKLIVALLKTTQLKKSIKAMQEKLLLELADLILATYGERESESETQESD